MPLDDAIKNLIAEAEKQFVLSSGTEPLIKKIQVAMQGLDVKYHELGLAFQHNILATIAVVEMPFTLACASADNAQFRRIHTAQRIDQRIRRARSGYTPTPLSTDEPIEEDDERQALENALKESEKFRESDEGQNCIVRDLCSFLINIVSHRKLSDAANELTLQGSVLLWGAIEVLCRDSFVVYLNAHPEAAKLLLAQPDLRKRFELQYLPFEALLEHNFDLSSHMGTALSHVKDLTDLETIKQVFDTLFLETTTTRSPFRDKQMWVLYQQRHLIVHRRAVIDTTYVEKTKGAVVVGERLSILPSEFKANLNLIVEAGASILESLPKAI